MVFMYFFQYFGQLNTNVQSGLQIANVVAFLEQLLQIVLEQVHDNNIKKLKVFIKLLLKMLTLNEMAIK